MHGEVQRDFHLEASLRVGSISRAIPDAHNGRTEINDDVEKYVCCIFYTNRNIL